MSGKPGNQSAILQTHTVEGELTPISCPLACTCVPWDMCPIAHRSPSSHYKVNKFSLQHSVLYSLARHLCFCLFLHQPHPFEDFLLTPEEKFQANSQLKQWKCLLLIKTECLQTHSPYLKKYLVLKSFYFLWYFMFGNIWSLLN